VRHRYRDSKIGHPTGGVPAKGPLSAPRRGSRPIRDRPGGPTTSPAAGRRGFTTCPSTSNTTQRWSSLTAASSTRQRPPRPRSLGSGERRAGVARRN